MKLDQIVETTFPPPNSIGKLSKLDISFGCEEKSNHFYPFLHKVKNDVTHYVNDMADGVDDFPKTHFSSSGEAMKHCWKYFNKNHFMMPAVKKHEA